MSGMKLIRYIIIFPFFLQVHVHAQMLSQTEAEAFINSLINDDINVAAYLDPYELKLSHRLNIEYQEVRHKFLISYGLDSDLKKDMRKKKLFYHIEIQKLGNGFSRILFTVPEKTYEQGFYFKGNKLISPISYYTWNWSRLESEHFNFVISDTIFWNSYCVENLEQFYIKIADLLELTEKQERKIRREKIYYILCKDEEEIKQLTGFSTRGMYNIAYDFVITTFNAHYHELLHLLINYKIEKPHLYTHPFFQEGFAVALGGRGGKEPGVILRLGSFLYESGMMDYVNLLNKPGFYQYDASMSYPASGLYNYFLLEELGIERYLVLYARYSGKAEEVDRMYIVQDDLPPIERWHEFLREFKKIDPISLSWNGKEADIIYRDASADILEDGNRYYFGIKDTLLIATGGVRHGFRSKKYEEIFPNKKYNGEKYLIAASNDEISIYNLYTGCLMANFVSAFSLPIKNVPIHEGYYLFNVPKKLFDEELKMIFNKKGCN